MAISGLDMCGDDLALPCWCKSHSSWEPRSLNRPLRLPPFSRKITGWREQSLGVPRACAAGGCAESSAPPHASFWSHVPGPVGNPEELERILGFLHGEVSQQDTQVCLNSDPWKGIIPPGSSQEAPLVVAELSQKGVVLAHVQVTTGIKDVHAVPGGNGSAERYRQRNSAMRTLSAMIVHTIEATLSV